MDWENLGVAIAALVIFLYNEYKHRKEKNKGKEEIKKVLKSEISKANGVPFAYIRHMPVPSWCKDTDGVMIWINEEYTRVFGIKSTQYEGKTDVEVWGKEIGRQFRINDLEVIMQKSAIETIELVPQDHRKPNQDLDEYHIITFPIFNENGEVVNVGGFAKKIIKR